jgi:hypothetical protein
MHQVIFHSRSPWAALFFAAFLLNSSATLAATRETAIPLKGHSIICPVYGKVGQPPLQIDEKIGEFQVITTLKNTPSGVQESSRVKFEKSIRNAVDSQSQEWGMIHSKRIEKTSGLTKQSWIELSAEAQFLRSTPAGAVLQDTETLRITIDLDAYVGPPSSADYYGSQLSFRSSLDPRKNLDTIVNCTWP